MFDAELYRDKAEVEQWKQRDPIRQLAERLTESGQLEASARSGLDEQVEREMANAVAFAEAGTWEPVEQLTRDVYTRTT
jgi:TPP-dependent pyruvate/acetoin dehydrogenase alpha subunit